MRTELVVISGIYLQSTGMRTETKASVGNLSTKRRNVDRNESQYR